MTGDRQNQSLEARADAFSHLKSGMAFLGFTFFLFCSFKFTHCVCVKTTLTFMYVPSAFLELKLNIVHYTGNGLFHTSW